MSKKLLSLAIGLTLLSASCKKDNTEKDAVVAKITDLKVPANFTWQTARDVNFTINVTDTRFQNKIHVVSIYLADPSTGAIAVAKGSAILGTPFIANISVPATINEAYVIKTAPDGSAVTEKIELNAVKVAVSLSSSNTKNAMLLTSLNSDVLSAITEPECGIAISTSNIKINNSTDVYCFTSDADLTINVEANNGGTLKINAPGKTITFGDNFNHTNLKLFIAAGTTVKFNRDLNIKAGEEIINNGILTAANLSSSGSLVNKGRASFSGGNFNLNSGAELTNSSEMTVESQNPNISGVLTNTGNLTFNSATFNSGSKLINYCSLTFNNNLQINTPEFNNYKLVMVKGDTYVNSSGTINLFDGAMHQTQDMTNMNGVVYGRGPQVSLFRTLGTVGDNVVNNSGYFKGALQYCGTRDLEVNQNNKKHFSDGAVKGCGVYIVKDDCNTIGNGTPPKEVKPDTDGDGVIDEQDAYPKDKSKAFNNYSVNFQNGGSTIAFEDSWPSVGDYDLNDVVLIYKHLVVTNANNIAVRIEGEWKLLASGGTNRNGAGIQFPLTNQSISDYKSSNGLSPEAGQDSLVIILFNNVRDQQATWNTIMSESISPVRTYTFSFNLTNGPALEVLGVSAFNPFIFNGSSNTIRGYETHLFGKKPTKLVDQSIFGTNDDNSLQGATYSTKTRLPWGIEIPVATFQYPLEQTSILESYLKFSNWASSGGTLDLDWYSNSGAGYRNESKLFPSISASK
jgi:LruC domain-containing protein